MPQQQEEEELQFSASHSGRVELFSLPRGSATVLSLQQRLEDLFDVPAAAQKVLLTKGRKLAFHSPDELLVTLLPPSTPGATKLLLIGPTSASFSALQASHAEREAKHQAFQHHRLHRHAPVRNTTNAQESAELERWKFGELKPFGAEVECQEERRRMLERLSEDRAVRDVMRRHRFAVGVLSELHPVTQPTLLGLNKNFGQEISLRLLTNDLTGTRSYLDVRKVLCHELAHNKIAPHDDNFKTLNSLLNRQVLEYEALHHLSAGSTSLEPEPWEPEEGERRQHVLGEKMEDKMAGALKWDEEEEVEMRRERGRMAAEGRRRREREARGRETGGS